jgi:hypothetical protein
MAEYLGRALPVRKHTRRQPREAQIGGFTAKCTTQNHAALRSISTVVACLEPPGDSYTTTLNTTTPTSNRYERCRHDQHGRRGGS